MIKVGPVNGEIRIEMSGKADELAKELVHSVARFHIALAEKDEEVGAEAMLEERDLFIEMTVEVFGEKLKQVMNEMLNRMDREQKNAKKEEEMKWN